MRILDAGRLGALLETTASVRGVKKTAAFYNLFYALMMHCKVRDEAVDAMGEAVTQRVVAELSSGSGADR